MVVDLGYFCLDLLAAGFVVQKIEKINTCIRFGNPISGASTCCYTALPALTCRACELVGVLPQAQIANVMDLFDPLS